MKKAPWEQYLGRWQAAGLLDAETATRLRSYEAEHQREQHFGWPVCLALALGGLLLSGGLLLFVAAHWDMMSPAQRFLLIVSVLIMVHGVGAAVADHFAPLATTLHAVGTSGLGAAIYLTAQIFHLEAHWPTGLLLWSVGAWAGWLLYRDWPHAALTSVLTPVWLMGEWMEATRGWSGAQQILVEGTWLLAVTYLTAMTAEHSTVVRKTLMWIGGLVVLPLTVLVIAFSKEGAGLSTMRLPQVYAVIGWALALGLPLAVAWWLRGVQAWMNGIAAMWVVLLGMLAGHGRHSEGFLSYVLYDLGPYWVCALGAVGLIVWGLHDYRKERINVGVAGFALTVLAFYFSNVMDKLGRSASLIGLGILFLVGGWLLERGRRRLVTFVEREPT